MSTTSRRMRQRLLSEAVRIGDVILSRTARDSDGVYWKTIAVDASNVDTSRESILWAEREDLYSGVTGISLFLAELYRHTRERRFLEAAADSLQWVVRRCERGALRRCDFYTGRMGVAYALLRLADVSGDRRHLARALSLARSCSEGPLAEPAGDDLVNGAAGALLGSLHLHAATGERWPLERSDQLVERLIGRAHPGRRGLYWDHAAEQVRGICSLAHGACGVGVALLEAASLPGHGALQRIADEAFAYENDWFDPATLNWPDFRKGIFYYSPDLEGRADLDEDTLSRGANTNTWCHGSVGIGLGRLRAFQIRGKQEDAADVRRALRRTLDARPPEEASAGSYTLCHGQGATIELLAEAGRILDEPRAREGADRLVAEALDARAKGICTSGYRFAGPEQDLSLFLGDAGVGYTFLRTLAPDRTPSVLVPAVSAPSGRIPRPEGRPSTVFSSSSIRRRLARRVFPRTLRVLESLVPGVLESHFEDRCDEVASEGTLFGRLVERLIADRMDASDVISDVYSLELDKWEMDQAVESCAVLAVDERRGRRRARLVEKMSDDLLLDLTLQLASRSKLWLAGWNWDLRNADRLLANLGTAPGSHPVLLTTYARLKTVEFWLAPFPYEALSRFVRPRRVSEVAKELKDVVEPGDESVLPPFVRQIRRGVLDGVLTEAAPTPRRRAQQRPEDHGLPK